MKYVSKWVVLAFLLGFAEISKAGEGHVGEIRYSILTLEQFQENYGPEWELMKGQEIPAGSALRHLWHESKVPDARGVYLRGYNEEREKETGNPAEQDLKVGTYQSDEFKSHSHGVNDPGHDHSFALAWPDGGGKTHSKVSTTWLGQPDRWEFRTSRQPTGITIQDAGGKEVRPRSLIVNTFIKMKESPKKDKVQAKELSDEGIAALKNHPAFLEAVDAAVKTLMDRR